MDVEGRAIGAYQILSPLGQGGMGEVYLARDPRLDRRVAIKLLPAHLAADAVARERLRREAMAAAALDHPFICKVFEIGEASGTVFIVMEYVAGQTLSHRLAAGPLPPAEALRIAGEIAEALEEAHNRRLLHRDLKPANILLTQQGHVKVMDFGLALRMDPESVQEDDTTGSMACPPLTERGMIVGTPDYMSPEQVRGAALDPRSDLFSFGICLAEMTTGTHPFRGPSRTDTMTAILRDPPRLAVPSGGDLSPGMMVLIHRLLAKSPGDRYQSMTELRADMNRMAAQSTTEMAILVESASTRIPLIGRGRERAELLHRLDEALAGRGSLVLIGGEPGIGKTHLTRWVLAEASRRGALAVIGHCYESEGAPPYVPFIEMLEYSARAAPRETFRFAVGDSASEVARLMPELRRMFPDIPPPIELPPEQQRRFLFNAYRDFADRASRLTPVVQVFEDLHWADEATLALLEHLAQTVDTIPRLMVGTYRDAEVDPSRPFSKTLASLVSRKLGSRITLKRFPVADVEEMLTAMSGREPPTSLAAVIFEATEGNPFFVEEVFRHLAEEGKLFDEHGVWRTSLRVDQLAVPEGVRLVIGRRLARLSGETRRILTTAAVIGRTFGLPLLEELESARPDAGLEAIEEAEQVQLVVAEPGREPRYRFVHELVRQTLAETLTLVRRQRLHARIAAAIEKVHAGNLDRQASALAHHLFQAGSAADPAKAVTFLTLAAQRASAAAAHQDGLLHIDNALTLIEEDQPARAAELHVARATALRSLVRFPEAIEAYERALTLFDAAGDRIRFAVTSIPLGYIHGWALNVGVARAILKRALDRLGSEPSPVGRPLLSLSAGCAAAAGDLDTALAELAESEKFGDSTDPATNAFVWSCESHTRFHAFQLDRAAEASRKASCAFDTVGDAWGQVDGAYVQAFHGVFFGHPEQVEPVVRDAVRRAERVGHQYSIWACQKGLVYLYWAQGKLELAEKTARETLALGQSFQCVYSFVDEMILGNLSFMRGRLEESREWFRRATDPQRPASAWQGNAEACAAWAMAVNGEPAALAALRAALHFLAGPGHQQAIGPLFGLVRVVEGLAILGQNDESAALQPAIEKLLAIGPVYAHDMTRTAAGVVAACGRDWPRSEAHYQVALQQAGALGYRVPQASARAWYAEMLLARNDPGDAGRARGLLAEALALYESIGMPLFARRASDRLASLN